VEEQPDQDSGLGSSTSLTTARSRPHPSDPGSPNSISDQEFVDARSDPGHSSGDLQKDRNLTRQKCRAVDPDPDAYPDPYWIRIQ
jgi:hypothetical protein